jgi:hypothetical protein
MRGPEQLSLSRLIEVTTDDFDNGLKSWQFSLLASHSKIKAIELAKILAKDRGLELFDGRRRLDESERKKRDYLEEIAEFADDYAGWVRERGIQPLLRDLLVGQCVAFENFLKTIGVASTLASKDKRSLSRLIFVPSEEFRSAHKEVNRWWKDQRDSRAEEFVKHFVLGRSVLTSSYSGLGRINLSRWSAIWDEAFRLRNAIVHSRARPDQQIEIGDEVFNPFEEALITEFTLRSIDQAFRVVADGFRMSLDDV